MSRSYGCRNGVMLKRLFQQFNMNGASWHILQILVRALVSHWWVLRYWKCASMLCLRFWSSKRVLKGFTDYDMIGDLDRRRSTSICSLYQGYVQFKIQKCVALPMTEYLILLVLRQERKLYRCKLFLQELGLKQEGYMVHLISRVLGIWVRMHVLFPYLTWSHWSCCNWREPTRIKINLI